MMYWTITATGYPRCTVTASSFEEAINKAMRLFPGFGRADIENVVGPYDSNYYRPE